MRTYSLHTSSCCSLSKMGPIVLLLSFSLLHLVQSELTPVFVKTGEDLLLNVQTPVTPGDDDQITWKVNDTKVIARFFGFLNQSRIIGSYSGRVTLFEDNFSLLLKSVRKSDSGDYRAHVSGVANKDLAEYKVTVLDPVSPVRLTVNSCSSDSSNLTVTCSTQDSLIRATFTCDNQTCSEERGDRGEFATPGTSLRVYLENGSVICNYSNEVSWTEDIKTIEDLCGKDPKYEFSKGSTNIWAIVVSIVAVVVVAAAVVLVIRVLKKRRKGREYKPDSRAETNE
ncbi:uncharacterized protein LOC117827362 isoform X1 [Xyrichtys novacula]|uniref:Uncharacterized protein LOC117827362 isoform X1 n=1 Tax=Xyrichtys novacula TaxID=13765 RepID=A0AAV1GK93_XYRNO|nr:uncharacterized protein LOC117827362 isoform X1 [Xyrichtys novacula]